MSWLTRLFRPKTKVFYIVFHYYPYGGLGLQHIGFRFECCDKDEAVEACAELYGIDLNKCSIVLLDEFYFIEPKTYVYEIIQREK